MPRNRFRVITKSLGSHAIIDRTTGKTIGLYVDGEKAWSAARNLNSHALTVGGKLEKLLKGPGLL